MPYDVRTDAAVADYLARRVREGLVPETVIDNLVNGYTAEPAADADRLHARRPVAPESYRFRYDFVVRDESVPRLHEFDFIVDMSSAAFGVVTVVYAEHHVD